MKTKIETNIKCKIDVEPDGSDKDPDPEEEEQGPEPHEDGRYGGDHQLLLQLTGKLRRGHL